MVEDWSAVKMSFPWDLLEALLGQRGYQSQRLLCRYFVAQLGSDNRIYYFFTVKKGILRTVVGGGASFAADANWLYIETDGGFTALN